MKFTIGIRMRLDGQLIRIPLSITSILPAIDASMPPTATTWSSVGVTASRSTKTIEPCSTAKILGHGGKMLRQVTKVCAISGSAYTSSINNSSVKPSNRFLRDCCPTRTKSSCWSLSKWSISLRLQPLAFWAVIRTACKRFKLVRRLKVYCAWWSINSVATVLSSELISLISVGLTGVLNAVLREAMLSPELVIGFKKGLKIASRSWMVWSKRLLIMSLEVG